MSTQITGAEALMRALVAEGVETVFGYPGGTIMPVYDALYDHTEELYHILTRHEQGAVHAAQGYARVSGKVGVAIATSGPGATNLITGIADAMLDSTPLVCVVGQVGTHLLGSDAFQETDFVGISMPVTKWNFQIRSAAEVPAVVAKAFYFARTGRPGPVVLDFTRNAQVELMEWKGYETFKGTRSYQPAPKPDLQSIQDAAELINAAQKPFALVGQGVVLGGAEDELLAFLEKADIPYGSTLLGLTATPYDHPLNKGMLGMHGNYGPNLKTNECDLLICIGGRFDDRVTSDVKTYAKQAKVIHMEIDPSEIDKNVMATVPVLGDVKMTLPLLTEAIQKASHAAWIEEFDACAKTEWERVIDKQINPGEGELTMGEVISRISERLAGNAIMVTDVGQQQMMAARYFKVAQKRSIVTSGGAGTMGFGLPSAIGAKVAAPERDVILFVGDGGIQMTIQELGTILQSKIGVKIVLLNNCFLGMVRQWQELFWNKRYSSTPMINPDFPAIANAYGINSRRVSVREELPGAIEAMLAGPEAFLLEVEVKPEDNVFPMVPAGARLDQIRFE